MEIPKEYVKAYQDKHLKLHELAEKINKSESVTNKLLRKMKVTKNRTLKIPDELVEEYVQGKIDLKGIAQKLNKCEKTITTALRHLDIDTGLHYCRIERTRERNEKIIERWKVLGSRGAVAKEFDLSRTRINGIVKKFLKSES